MVPPDSHAHCSPAGVVGILLVLVVLPIPIPYQPGKPSDRTQQLRRSQIAAVSREAVDAVAAGSRERDSVVAFMARDLSVVAASVEELHG